MPPLFMVGSTFVKKKKGIYGGREREKKRRQ
jgi:hypothetical protein